MTLLFNRGPFVKALTDAQSGKSLSLLQLAIALNIPPTALNDIVNFRRDPDIREYYSICKFLEAGMSTFFTEL